MLRSASRRFVFLAAALLASTAVQAGTPLRVQLPADAGQASGRLLVSLQPASVAEKNARDGVVRSVAMSRSAASPAP